MYFFDKYAEGVEQLPIITGRFLGFKAQTCCGKAHVLITFRNEHILL